MLPLTETVSPNDEAAVADAVRKAHASGDPVYPVGGGTAQQGVRPTRPGLGLSLLNLNRILDYPARDLTITVEAGVTLAELSKRLTPEGQRLPIDVPCADRATIGGLLATDSSGPRRLGWGTIRDYLLGFHAIDGTGTIFSGGGRVVKNAAGYDLCKMMIGSMGTLGVITQATLMVKPIPKASALLLYPLDKAETAERLLDEMIHAALLPTAVDILIGIPDGEEHPFGRLVVAVEGSHAEVEWYVERLDRMWQTNGDRLDAKPSAQLWQQMTDFTAEDDCDTPSTVLEIDVLPSAVVEMIYRLRAIDTTATILAHAAVGVVKVRLTLSSGDLERMLRKQIRPAVVELDGKMVVRSYPVDVTLDRQTVWGPVSPTMRVMEALKRQFDPHDILNPGRYVF